MLEIFDLAKEKPIIDAESVSRVWQTTDKGNKVLLIRLPRTQVTQYTNLYIIQQQ